MTSVQDHTPVVKELSDKGQQDPQPASQTVQPPAVPLKAKPRDSPESPRPPTATSETLREPSPPRFSQLLSILPGASDSISSRRGASTATNPATLVNFPGTVTDPNTGSASNVTGGVQNAPAIQDRNQNHSISLAPDRRQSTLYDPIRGESGVQIYIPDESELDRRPSPRRVSVPRPRPIYNPTQDGNGNGNGSRALRTTDSFSAPQEPEKPRERTVKERIEPTLTAARDERDKYTKQARFQSLTINGAIGLQVITGALVTGVAAASKNIGAAVAVLGGISTALASYLAKARGSGEPEFSILRSRELSTFVREVDAFILDHGDKVGMEFDQEITEYRLRFEEIIKTDGEDKRGGTNGPDRSRVNGNMYPANQQGMAGAYSGKNYQAAPPPADGRYGQPSEKQMQWKNEKALGGMV